MKKKIGLFVLMIFMKSTGVIAQDTWYIQDSPVLETLYSVYFVNNTTGWITGGNGTILYTDNKGKTWNQQTYNQTQDLHSVCFTDKSTGWIAGSHGTILKTNNAGTDWIKQDLVGVSDTSFFDVFFINDSTGWIVGRYGTILKTENNGENWFNQNSNTEELLLSIYFVNQDTGWIVGDRTILKTINGGVDWVLQDDGIDDSYKSVYFMDADTGWVCGGWTDAIILKTTDGGVNWNIENSGFTDDLHSICFINNSTAWIAGKNGSIFNTINCGDTWTQQESHTPNSTLLSIYFADINNGWIVGENGTILSTVDPNSTGIVEVGNSYPDGIMLMQNYPNPFNPSTVIQFNLNKPAYVILNVYNILGKKVDTLLQDYRQAGHYKFIWNAEGFSSGAYFITLESDNFAQSRKIILKK